MIRAFAGAGGKTGLIHEYAQRLAAQGRKVLICTSTHMYIEPSTLLTDDPQEIEKCLQEKGICMAGTSSGEKIGPLSEETYLAACGFADEVLVEADGSRHLPLKWPGENEPVIYDNTDEIIVVYGLHSLGMKVKDAVHRAENCGAAGGDDIIGACDIQRIVNCGYIRPLREKYMDKKVELCGRGWRNLYERALASVIDAGLDAGILDEKWFEEKPLLVICGGGHISSVLVSMASFLDFRIRVIDDRPEFASEERFPGADEVICDSFNNLENHMEKDAYYVIVTRGHKDDRLCLEKILGTQCSYIGMIGSRKKVKKTYEMLTEEGFSEELLKTVHAPVGLDIGAETPAEIAVSILAEIISEKNKESSSSASRRILEYDGEGTLCIITDKTGSSPRSRGTMMIVTKDGIIDSIGGGAVEAAVIEDAGKIHEVTEKEYVLESGGELGMICGGTNRVLLIPLKGK